MGKRIMIPLMDPAAIEANQNGRITDEQRKQATPSRGWAIFEIAVYSFVFFIYVSFIIIILLIPIKYLIRDLTSRSSADITLDYLFLFVVVAFGVILGGRLVYSIRWQILARRELAEPAITTIEGRVIYNQSEARYQANVPRLKLLGIDGTNEVLLPPGVYRLYYLPFARRVLSGEWLRPNEPGGPYTEILRALMQTNDFIAEDLALNQKGLLSPRQQEKLFGNEKNRAGGSLEVPLATLEGRVERVAGNGDDGDYYRYRWCTIQPLVIDVPQRAYYALIPGMYYRAYYLANPLRLVSLEPTSVGRRFFCSSAAEAQPH